MPGLAREEKAGPHVCCRSHRTDARGCHRARRPLASRAAVSILDRGPFILHPLRVMLQVDADDARIIAVLHDVLEDTACSVVDLRRAGYSEQVIKALDRLTRRDGEAYEPYIERVAEDTLARQVKLADLTDNLANNRRLADVSARRDVQERITRYERAIARLQAATAAAANAEPPQ